jgi:ureidoacrylate peracid hydrolase
MPEEFPIIPEKTGMLFFDCYNGNDPAATEALRAAGYIDRLVKIEQACRQAGIAIFYTQPEHRKDGKDWGLTVVDAAMSGDKTGGPRVSYHNGVNYKGSHYAEILPEIAPQEGDYIITKHRWSAFHDTCLDLSLRTAGIDTIMIAGGGVAIGVGSTCYSARDLNYNQIVLRDVIRGRSPILELYLDDIFPGFTRVMTIDEAISKFAVPAAA